MDVGGTILSAGFDRCASRQTELRIAEHRLASAAHSIGTHHKTCAKGQKTLLECKGVASVKPRCDAYRQEQQRREPRGNIRDRKSEDELCDAECLIEPYPFA